MVAADQTQTLIYGLLFGCLLMLILHNLTRFAYHRSRSSLWLAASELLLMLSLALLLNLVRPMAAELARIQTPGAYLALLLTAPCGLMLRLSFLHAPGSTPAEQIVDGRYPVYRAVWPAVVVRQHPAAEHHDLRAGGAGGPEHAVWSRHITGRKATARHACS